MSSAFRETQSMIRGKFDKGKWEQWFAWHPVRLLGTFRFAWLRRVSRRYVLTEQNQLKTDYTDVPAEHPAGYGLRKHDLKSEAIHHPSENAAEYRGYHLEQKTLRVGWQIIITKNDEFVSNGHILKDLGAALSEAHSYIDNLLAQP